MSRSRSVDKHYPFTRSSLTDKPIIRHSTLTRPTILSITAAGPPRGQKNETRDAALGEGEDGEREREKKRGCSRRESYNSTKHNPRVNLTSPSSPSKSEPGERGRDACSGGPGEKDRARKGNPVRSNGERERERGVDGFSGVRDEGRGGGRRMVDGAKDRKRGRGGGGRGGSGSAPLRSFFSLAQRLIGFFCRRGSEETFKLL